MYYESRLLKSILHEKSLTETEPKKLTNEQKRKFIEAVSNFHKIGESIYSTTKLSEISKTLKEIVSDAKQLTVVESESWFDNVTVTRHMKQLSEACSAFEKASDEMVTLQQRLENAYEDMGMVLSKYYNISEAIKDKNI